MLFMPRGLVSMEDCSKTRANKKKRGKTVFILSHDWLMEVNRALTRSLSSGKILVNVHYPCEVNSYICSKSTHKPPFFLSSVCKTH